MTAYDGEPVVEISSLRCISQLRGCGAPEAYIQLERSSPPYGKMSWEVDFDNFRTTSDAEGLGSSDWMNSVLFMYPARMILHLGSRNLRNLQILQKNPRASHTAVAMTRRGRHPQGVSRNFQNVTVVKLEELYSPEEGSYNILAVDRAVINHGYFPSI